MPMTLRPIPASEPHSETVPKRVDRKTGAELVSLYFFPVTPRAMETWRLDWRILNGKAVCETAALFAAAQERLDSARPAQPPPGPARAKAQRTTQQAA